MRFYNLNVQHLFTRCVLVKSVLCVSPGEWFLWPGMSSVSFQEGNWQRFPWHDAVQMEVPRVDSNKFSNNIYQLFFKKIYIDWLILEREEGGKIERAREKSIYCSNYLCILWLILIYALTWHRTYKLGVSGWCSNQLSYLTSLPILPIALYCHLTMT